MKKRVIAYDVVRASKLRAEVKTILRLMAEAIREHIDSANNPYALQQLREAEERIEEL